MGVEDEYERWRTSRSSPWHDTISAVAVGRAERFEERRPRITRVFGDDVETMRTVRRVFELFEMSWHDCYGEITPPEHVVDEVLLCSRGTIDGLVAAAHQAVIDRRDLHVWASAIRAE
jgi:hypothetical protein